VKFVITGTFVERNIFSLVYSSHFVRHVKFVLCNFVWFHFLCYVVFWFLRLDFLGWLIGLLSTPV